MLQVTLLRPAEAERHSGWDISFIGKCALPGLLNKSAVTAQHDYKQLSLMGGFNLREVMCQGLLVVTQYAEREYDLFKGRIIITTCGAL